MQGLSIRLYHPESCPFDTFAYVDDDGAYASGLMQASLRPATASIVRLLTKRRAVNAYAILAVIRSYCAQTARDKCRAEFAVVNMVP